MRKKKDVPFDFEPHPGLVVKTAEGKAVEDDHEQKLTKKEVQVFLPMAQKLLESHDEHYYTEMDELGEAAYPKTKYPDMRESERRVKTQKVLSMLRTHLKKVHGEDVIEYSRYRDVYRIKPAHLCIHLKNKD